MLAPSRPLRAAYGGALRAALTALARGAPRAAIGSTKGNGRTRTQRRGHHDVTTKIEVRRERIRLAPKAEACSRKQMARSIDPKTRDIPGNPVVRFMPRYCLELALRYPSWQRSHAAASTGRTYDRNRFDPLTPLSLAGRGPSTYGLLRRCASRNDRKMRRAATIYRVSPPSTVIVCPVTIAAPKPRNSTTSARSSGWQRRLSNARSID